MDGQVYFYEDYLALTEVINKCRKILTLSLIPFKVFQKFGKFIVLGFLICVTLLITSSTIKLKENSLNVCMNFLMLSGYIQVIMKVYSIVTKSDYLNSILEWIQSLHLVPDCDLFKIAAEKHLKKTMWIIKYISMMLVILYFATNLSMSIYSIATDRRVLQVPSILSQEVPYIVTYIPQILLITVSSHILTMSDMVFIHLALYFLHL
uniref:Uncharacterized protein n=1 Tax=Phlebotomus papatasi TaxID=29031 RepID=A0A3F2ZEG7_PHLPP